MAHSNSDRTNRVGGPSPSWPWENDENPAINTTANSHSRTARWCTKSAEMKAAGDEKGKKEAFSAHLQAAATQPRKAIKVYSNTNNKRRKESSEHEMQRRRIYSQSILLYCRWVRADGSTYRVVVPYTHPAKEASSHTYQHSPVVLEQLCTCSSTDRLHHHDGHL